MGMSDNNPRMEMYRDYYVKAKYAIEKAGLDATYNGHLMKQISLELGGKRLDMILAEDVVLVFVDGERVFYFDPENLEVESIDGGWMKMVNILYQTVIDVDNNRSR